MLGFDRPAKRSRSAVDDTAAVGCRGGGGEGGGGEGGGGEGGGDGVAGGGGGEGKGKDTIC